jgi:hypothetical protein
MAARFSWLWLADGNRPLRVDINAPASTTQTVLSDGVQQLFGNAAGLFALDANSTEIRVLDDNTGAVLSSVRFPGQEFGHVDDRRRDPGVATGNCGDVLLVAGGGAPGLEATKISDVSQDLPTVAALGSLWVGDVIRSEIVRVHQMGTQQTRRPPPTLHHRCLATPDSYQPNSYDRESGFLTIEHMFDTVWLWMDGRCGGSVTRSC